MTEPAAWHQKAAEEIGNSVVGRVHRGDPIATRHIAALIAAHDPDWVLVQEAEKMRKAFRSHIGAHYDDCGCAACSAEADFIRALADMMAKTRERSRP